MTCSLTLDGSALWDHLRKVPLSDKEFPGSIPRMQSVMDSHPITCAAAQEGVLKMGPKHFFDDEETEIRIALAWVKNKSLALVVMTGKEELRVCGNPLCCVCLAVRAPVIGISKPILENLTQFKRGFGSFIDVWQQGVVIHIAAPRAGISFGENAVAGKI